jgi:thiol-disulfide isomerase/thioredoxin
MRRVSFVAGAAFCGLAVPFRADAAEEREKPHVHGPGGVTIIPEKRVINWSIDVLDGPRFELKAYRGMVVFCNVFATWCPPCREEQPGVVAFARAHSDDTAVIGIDIAEEDNEVRAYRKKFEIPYPIAMWRERYSVPAIFKKGIAYPTTIVFRPDGTLSCAWMGDRSPEWFEAERTYALEDPAPAPSPSPSPSPSARGSG